jgi:hypothetical protein
MEIQTNQYINKNMLNYHLQFAKLQNNLLEVRIINRDLRNNFEVLYWVITICSKFDCSKNLLDTIILLLDTIRAIIFFLVNCSNPVNLWELT